LVYGPSVGDSLVEDEDGSLDPPPPPPPLVVLPMASVVPLP
jgi:hypothetical protein